MEHGVHNNLSIFISSQIEILDMPLITIPNHPQSFQPTSSQLVQMSIHIKLTRNRNLLVCLG